MSYTKRKMVSTAKRTTKKVNHSDQYDSEFQDLIYDSVRGERECVMKGLGDIGKN